MRSGEAPGFIDVFQATVYWLRCTQPRTLPAARPSAALHGRQNSEAANGFSSIPETLFLLAHSQVFLCNLFKLLGLLRYKVLY